jgi:hypothetical protein
MVAFCYHDYKTDAMEKLYVDDSFCASADAVHLGRAIPGIAIWVEGHLLRQRH